MTLVRETNLFKCIKQNPRLNSIVDLNLRKIKNLFVFRTKI